jgi:hypothetical protein
MCPCSPPSSQARRRPQPPAELAFGIRRGHPFADLHGGSPGAPVPSARPPSARPACRLLRARLATRCPGSGPCASLVRLASWTVAPVSLWTSACLPEPTAGGKPAVAFGACSRRTKWIPVIYPVVGPILRGPAPHSLPIESSLVPGRRRGPLPSSGEKAWSPWETEGDRMGTDPWAE